MSRKGSTEMPRGSENLTQVKHGVYFDTNLIIGSFITVAQESMNVIISSINIFLRRI